jgi:hypothetical protein
MQSFAKIAAPLTELLYLNSRYIWQEPQRLAFTELKRVMEEEVTLSQPDYSKPFDGDATHLIEPLVLL